MIPIAHSRYKTTRQQKFQASESRALVRPAACNKNFDILTTRVFPFSCLQRTSTTRELAQRILQMPPHVTLICAAVQQAMPASCASRAFGMSRLLATSHSSRNLLHDNKQHTGKSGHAQARKCRQYFVQPHLRPARLQDKRPRCPEVQPPPPPASSNTNPAQHDHPTRQRRARRHSKQSVTGNLPLGNGR